MKVLRRSLFPKVLFTGKSESTSHVMRVVHIGTADNSGGAARAAFQLHTGLLAKGHDSSMLVGQKTEPRQEIVRIGFPRTIPGKICDRLVQKCESWSGFQYLIQPLKNRFLHHPLVKNADVIHLHNLHGSFFSFTILPKLACQAPLVWTLHDTWALTGHCSYNYDCERWQAGCGHCPNLREYPSILIDTTAFLWRKKYQSYHQSNITVVAPSRWLYDMARKSPLFEGKIIRCIPYGINLDEFRPGGQLEARDALDIPRDAQVIMVVAFADQIAGAGRKGSRCFKEALKTLNLKRRPWILSVGSRGVFETCKNLVSVREVGYLDSSDLMRRCYVAADVFALPTLADNLPVSLIEATASGTPSVAFQVGGVRDIVIHKETGYLAVPKDAVDLANGIRWVLADSTRLAAIRDRCRERARHEYSIQLEVERYLELYRGLKMAGAGP